jgi:hypothetical protein
VYTHSVNFVDWDGVVVASTGLPSDLEAGGLEVLSGRCSAFESWPSGGNGGGRAKTTGGCPGEKSSQRGSCGGGGAKCTLRAAAAPGGRKSRKRTAAGG